MTLPRNFKMTARMSTGGNAPRRRLMGVRRPLRRQRVGQTPAASRRSARIARCSGVIDAVTEAVILNFDLRPKRPQRVRHKITARRDDGSYMNRVQLATRAAELAEEAQAATDAAVQAAARFAAQARREQEHVNWDAHIQYVQSLHESDDAVIGPDPDETESDVEVSIGHDPNYLHDYEFDDFSEYEPSTPSYCPEHS